MKTFAEFLEESKSFDQMEKYYSKTQNLQFVEDSEKKHQFTGSTLGNNTDKLYVADIALKGAETRMMDIFALDAHDVQRYGKNVYRFETHASKAGKMRPVIKIDLTKGMIYRATQESLDNDGVDFETKGEKIQWLVVYKKDLFLKNQK